MKHLTNTQPAHLLYLCRQSKNNTKDKHAHAKWTPKWQNFQAKKNVFLLLLFLTKTVLSLIHIHRFSLSALITLSYRISITTKLQTSLYISLHFNINTVTYSHTHTHFLTFHLSVDSPKRSHVVCPSIMFIDQKGSHQLQALLFTACLLITVCYNYECYNHYKNWTYNQKTDVNQLCIYLHVS